MIELCKEKIHALDNNRKPPVNAKEIVAAYRQRIKEVRGWMAGEVVEK